MNNVSLQESSRPVVAKSASSGAVNAKVASPEALRLLQLSPIETVWGREGRTILERLPQESQAYQVGYYEDQAYVYIDPNFGLGYGAGSLQTETGVDNRSLLIVQDGTITWKGGQVEVPLLQVNTSLLNEGLGLQTGEYQIGYTLRLDKPESKSLIPGYSLVRVEDQSLGEAAVAIASNAQSKKYQAEFALNSFQVNKSWRPGGPDETTEFFPGASLFLDFQVPVHSETFVLSSNELDFNSTASCTAYWSDNGIVWTKAEEVRSIGKSWTLNVKDGKTTHRYWNFFFWGGQVSVDEISYTGEAYFPDLRVVGDITIAEPFIDDLYSDIEGDFILLSHFTVQEGAITEVRDQRRFIGRKYEPVSSWLTTFQDEQLSCLFDYVENYSTKYLAPPTADFHIYEELDDNICSGLGALTIGEEEEDLRVVLPDVVEIRGEYGGPSEAELSVVSQIGNEGLLSTEDGDVLIAQNHDFPGLGGISALELNLVRDPITDDGLATKGVTDEIFSRPWSVDDGIY